MRYWLFDAKKLIIDFDIVQCIYKAPVHRQSKKCVPKSDQGKNVNS